MDMNEIVDPVLGLTRGDVEAFKARRAAKGRRDARVCVCGHAGGAHFPLGKATRGDIASYKPGEVGCQAGKTPCACNEFVYVLRASDVRSFIYKTEGPDGAHALSKGVDATVGRGVAVEWHEDLGCFTCGKTPAEVGRLIPIAYNERKFEALRDTPINRLHCGECRTLTYNLAHGAGSAPNVGPSA